MKFQNRILLSTTMIKSGAILFFVAQATLIAGTVNWQGHDRIDSSIEYHKFTAN
jgi:hypothetical protein